MEISLQLPLKEMVEKSAIDSSSLPNSILNRQQADRFIDMVVDTSTLLKRVRVKKMNSPKIEINKLDLGTIVTQGAHTTSRATTRTPSESVINLDTEKYRSAFDLKSDFLEDNIEGSGARDTILSMFTKAISIDTEMASIEGDASLDTGDDQSDENNLFGVNDGWRKILGARVPTANKVDAAGAGASKELFYEMKRRIPKRYRVAKPSYVWVTSSYVYDKWILDWTNRETAGGDASLTTGMAPGPFGIPILEVPLMPEDLSWGTAGSDGTEIWLTPLANLIYGVQREFTIEWERKPRHDMWESTVHFRCDFEVENPDLVVLAQNISLSGTDFTA